MQSFHQSRGRSYFDLTCAFAIAASCAVGWMQTGASAWLGLAAVFLVQGIVHLTDRPRARDEVPAGSRPSAPEQRAAEPPFAVVNIRDDEPAALPPILGIEEAEPLAIEIEPAVAAAKPKKRSRKKAPAPAAAEAEPPPVEVFPLVPPSYAEEDHGPIAPLFEPQPLARQARAIFGRKAG